MHAVHGPVAHAARAQRTSIAAAIVQNAPGVAELIAVLPNGLGDVAIGVGMLLVEPVGHEAHPVALIVSLRCFHIIERWQPSSAVPIRLISIPSECFLLLRVPS